jgi:hypothetical protein
METDSLTPDAEETAMRDMGAAIDQNEGRVPDAPEMSQETPDARPVDPDLAPQPDAPTPEAPEQPDVPEPQRDSPNQVPRDPRTGKFQQRPDTEYSRAQKEAERKERSWQALQAEKEQFRRMTSQWEEQQRMAQLEQTRKTYQPLRRDGLTAKEYYDGAQVFEKEGDYENAYKAHRVAQEMFQQEQGRTQQMQGVEAEYQWRKGMETAVRMEPKIADPNSPIAQHLERIIQQNPWIYHIPNGFLRAAEVADMLTKMSDLKEKDDEIVSLKAQLEKHQRKSQPSKGGYASPRYGEKDFEDMDLPEMESHLRHLTADADNYRG